MRAARIQSVAAYRGLAGPQPERVDQPAEAHVAHDRPPEFNDLLFGVVAKQVFEQILVDVVVVDEEPLRVGECGLLRCAEVLVAPRPDLGDSLFLKCFESP